MDTVLRSDNSTFLLHRDQDEKCTDATPPTRGNNELELKIFPALPRATWWTLPAAATHPTENLGKNRER